jgi:hypothetical protein
MPLPTFAARSIEMPPLDIGEFPKTSELVAATPELIARIAEALPAMTYRVSSVCPQLGEQIVHFANKSDAAAQIIASFLGRAFYDLRTVLGDSEQAFERPSNVLAYTHYRDRSWRPYHFDISPYPANAPIGVRYLTTNVLPTKIEALPNYRAGNIARIRVDRERHCAPVIEASPERPRLLLWLDIL